ncbi:protein Aster-B [Drosophila pseudoobscura]|uniref:Protein Aster-B n=1 Tax=Drosophila pseudoobscura pseudoobscura TaxID=46245 RepID=A0A6I8USV0_DROPS|nr:protein Aster-B [Drosophila pseudoobscura]
MEALRFRFGKWGGAKRSKSTSKPLTRNTTAASSRSISRATNASLTSLARRRRTTRHMKAKSVAFDQNNYVVAGGKAKKRMSNARPSNADQGITTKRGMTVVEVIMPIRDSLEGKYNCNALHEGRKVLNEKMRVHVDTLFNMLFSATSPFFQKFHEMRNSTDLKLGEWRKNAAGLNERVITVTVALKGNVGPKVAKVTETQTLRDCTRPGQLYSIDATSVNADIPYADSFMVAMHLCLRGTPEGHTKILVLAQVKIVKPVWAVVQSFIEKHTYAGVEEFFQSLYSALLRDQRRTTTLPASGSTY